MSEQPFWERGIIGLLLRDIRTYFRHHFTWRGFLRKNRAGIAAGVLITSVYVFLFATSAGRQLLPALMDPALVRWVGVAYLVLLFSATVMVAVTRGVAWLLVSSALPGAPDDTSREPYPGVYLLGRYWFLVLLVAHLLASVFLTGVVVLFVDVGRTGFITEPAWLGLVAASAVPVLWKSFGDNDLKRIAGLVGLFYWHDYESEREPAARAAEVDLHIDETLGRLAYYGRCRNFYRVNGLNDPPLWVFTRAQRDALRKQYDDIEDSITAAAEILEMYKQAGYGRHPEPAGPAA
jgi:hypothetical protein